MTTAHQAPLSMGILQARTLEWVAMTSSRGSSQPRNQTKVSLIAGYLYLQDLQCRILYHLSHQRSPCCCITSVMSDSVRPHRRQPNRLSHPWDSPGKNAGVGCHFLLQCMKVKSESEVAQSCPTLSDSMDCSLLGSSIHGIFQARVLEWGVIAFSKRSPYETL